MSSGRYLYLSGTLDNPIIQSQVLSWLDVLNQNGISFDLFCFIPLQHLIRNRKKEFGLLRYYRGILGGSITIIPIVRSKDDWNLISLWIKLIAVWIYLLRHRGTKVIIQTRSRFNFDVIRWVKAISKGTRLIYDMRGAAAAEFVNSFGTDDPNSDVLKPHLHQYARVLESEMRMVRISDATLCVSHKLKEYIMEHLPFLPDGRLYVVPGAADQTVFFFDNSLRQATRASLGFDQHSVMIYCGSLKHYWHKSELIFKYAAMAMSEIKGLLFICLTKDSDVAHSLAEQQGLDSSRFVSKFINKASEVNAYYNAADYAVLFRDDIATNRVSSPTKLAEYLLAGLPVLVSRNIGDFSEFISDNGFGVVSDNAPDALLQFTRSLFFRDVDRSKISQNAGKRFAKQSVVGEALRAYAEITLQKDK